MKQWQVKTLEQADLPNLPARHVSSTASIQGVAGGPEYPGLIVRLLALRGFVEPENIRDFHTMLEL